MKPIPEDPEIEERISFEIMPDAYGEEERITSWHCYLQDTMNFPFRATCIRKMSSSLLRKGEEVEVLSMTDEDDLLPRYVQVKWQDREFAVPLAQLEGIDVNDETHQAITDWHYWVGRGYLF